MRPTTVISALALFALTPVAIAHHSRAAIYDVNAMTEIEGEVTRILWRNPHIRFWLEAEVAGETVLYEIESTPPGTLERHGITAEILSVGQTIRVAGTPGRFDAYAMEAKNFLLPDGREVLIQRDSEPRWSDRTVGWANKSLSGVRVDAAEAKAAGIFRVWSRDEDSLFRVRQGSNLSLVGMPEYPLTASASLTRKNFDPVADNPIPGCTPKGMPHILGQPYPVEFVDQGERILLRIEEYDLTRVIHMTNEPTPSEPTPLGLSIGRWDGDSLLVTTSSILAPQFSAGIPLSESARVEERFALRDDQARLNFRVTVTDPAIFTEPVTREKYWTWIPGVEIQPYECMVEE
jgi:hypothetical protein